MESGEAKFKMAGGAERSVDFIATRRRKKKNPKNLDVFLLLFIDFIISVLK